MKRRDFIKNSLLFAASIPLLSGCKTKVKKYTVADIPHIDCINCHHCHCPEGIDIPRIFFMYNDYVHDSSDTKSRKERFVANYDTLPGNMRAFKCTSCGHCMHNCPKMLNIPELLAQIDKIYNDSRSI